MMQYWIDKKSSCKMCEPDCVDEWLFDIWAIGCDYDGYHSAEDLKKLIDELVGMANKARDCLWDGKLFGIHGHPEEKENAMNEVRTCDHCNKVHCVVDPLSSGGCHWGMKE